MNHRDSEGHQPFLFPPRPSRFLGCRTFNAKTRAFLGKSGRLAVLDSPNLRVEKIDSTFARERKGHIIKKQKE